MTELSGKESFWARYDRMNTPEEVIFFDGRITPREVCGFARGVGVIYGATKEQKPDVIFLPLRGAEPIDAAMEAYEENDGINFNRSYLPIGSHTNVINIRQSGYNATTKKAIIKEELDRLSYRISEMERVVFIDEVQSGRTSSTGVIILAELLDPQVTINFIAAQDVRERAKTREKTRIFVNLVTNQDRRVKTNSIALPLFYIDRTPLLSTIFRPTTTGPMQEDWRMLMVMKNPDAHRVFKNLARIAIHPELFGALLGEREALQKKDSISTIEQSYALYYELQGWISEVLVRYVNEPNKKNHVIQWLKAYKKECLKRDP